jgi:IS30 family transposase
LRELKRNAPPVHPTDYRPYRAHLSAGKRRKIAGARDRLKDSRIRDYTSQKLKVGWSPEQIQGRIGTDLPGLSISYEAIYQYVYAKARQLIEFLPRRHSKRRAKVSARQVKRLSIPNRIFIGNRPQEINDRSVFGHWEADSMVSSASRAAAHVLVERKSRLVRITKIPQNNSSFVRETLLRRLILDPKRCRRSITYDNGTENIRHQEVNRRLKTQSYFCRPYHSWEKGTVENTIGLIRRFIPKKTDIELVPSSQIRRVENLLNNRPRKCLNYRTPREVFDSLNGAVGG